MFSSSRVLARDNRFFSKAWTARFFGPLFFALLAWAYGWRMYQLHLPEAYVFDEVYHAVTAKLIARNDPQAFEWWNEPPEPDTSVDWLHPPYAKYTQATSMLVFGENSFGWRFSSAVFGTAVIGVTVLLAIELFKDQRVGLLAGFLASLDGLLLVQSRIAMNDIHVTFFILLTILWLARFFKTRKFTWLVATGVAAGLAIGTKWSGFFILGWAGLLTGLFMIKTAYESVKKINTNFLFVAVDKLISVIGPLVLIPILLYLLAYWQMFFLHGKSIVCLHQTYEQGVCHRVYAENPETGQFEDSGRFISHFHELHRQILNYQTTLEATHTYQSRPWQWFLNLKPVWFYVEYSSAGPDTVSNIYALGNPALFWIGDVAVLMAALVLLHPIIYWVLIFLHKNVALSLPHVLKKARLSIDEYSNLWLIFSAYCIVWLPWILSPRIMFFYHYTPAVPLLCIILAWVMQRYFLGSKPRGVLTISILTLITTTFVLFLPLWLGWPVGTDWNELLYRSIPAWK